jgi:hypothetical protein
VFHIDSPGKLFDFTDEASPGSGSKCNDFFLLLIGYAFLHNAFLHNTGLE